MTRINQADKFMRDLGLPEVYRVGGSVRDELMDRAPKDPDYVVRQVSLPELGKALMKARAKPVKLKLRTGEQVGWIVGLQGIGKVDIALPRQEVSTGGGRHDFDITVDPQVTLEKDARRRDFTINALYRNLANGQVVDPTGNGIRDIGSKLISIISDDSFRDDPLRILRALRFHATLPGFDLWAGTRSAMAKQAVAVTGLTQKGVSGTAWDELTKILMGHNVEQAMIEMRNSGVLAHFLPELKPIVNHASKSPFHDMTTDDHTFAALRAAAGLHLNLRVRVALLFHDAGKPEVEQPGRPFYVGHEEASAKLARAALVRLNVPKRLRDDVLIIIRRHMVGLSGKTRPAKVRTWRCEVGDEMLSDIFKHRLADVMGKGSIDYGAVEAITRLESIRAEAEKMRVPTSPRDLAVSGKDALDRGLQGEAIGRALRKLLHEVVSQPDAKRLSREWQLGRLGR
jgi:tRNA nucleotidyltransferase (CCA-adding enzyme)